MKNAFPLIFILLVFLSFSAGTEAAVDADAGIGTFNVESNGATILEGAYPVLSSNTRALKPGAGLRLAGSSGSSSSQKTGMKYSEHSVLYENNDGEKMLELIVREYPGAVTIGYSHPGKIKLSANGGFKLFIENIPSLKRAMCANRFKQYWTRPEFINSPGEIPGETQFMLWQHEGGDFFAAIPLVGGGMKTVIASENGVPVIRQTSYDAGFAPKGAPLLAIAWGSDPYETIHRLYEIGMAFMGNPGKLRIEKKYPEIFEGIGWCSWNAFYSDVTGDDIINAAASFRDAEFPIRFMIVDDGWQDVSQKEKRKGRKLSGFDAIPEKFPGGVAALVSTLKNEYGIPFVGFWHAYQGYWDGVESGGPLEEKYGDNLMESLSGNLFPNPLDKKGYRFFYDYHKHLKDAGADLVKVDNQSTIYPFTLNKAPIGHAARGWQDNLQASVVSNFAGHVINCMCMTIENIYFWHSTNIARSSDDFFPDIKDNPAAHAIHNIYNSLWYSELTYPDFDMFQSHHEFGEMHSVLRAVSGGPVYITDTPGLQDWSILWKLVLSDGTVLRPDIPARPTRDILFADPTVTPVPLKAFTRVGDTGLIAAFNVNNSGDDVTGTISPRHAEGIEGVNFAVYEHFSGRTENVHLNGGMKVTLPKFGAALFTIVPIKDGAAPIGLLNKYVSAGAIQKKASEPGLMKIWLKEGGAFGAYSESKPEKVAIGKDYLPEDQWTYENNLLKFNVPKEGSMEITLHLKIEKKCKGKL